MHLSITLDNDQLDAQIVFNTFITILYMYMFWAISCSSSGCQIVLTQHLVSSLSVSDRPVHRLRKNCLIVLSQPVHRTFTYWQSRYQMLYEYNLTSWGWARYCSKHVHVEDHYYYFQLRTAALRLIVRSWLDVPTFATRRLHACHHATAPSGGRWNCGREMSGNFA